jgi:uncharacterized protein YggE
MSQGVAVFPTHSLRNKEAGTKCLKRKNLTMTSTSRLRPLARPFLLAGLALALASPALAQTPPTPREAVIAVSGDGHAAVAPDLAILSFSVVSDGKTAREALDANTKSMTDVLGALRSGGIAERDLQTSGFAVNPQYRYPENNNGSEPPVLIGYQVANTLTIRLRDVAKLGAVIDEAVTLGVNQGGSIQFSNDKPEATLTEARKAAVADAVAKARTLAEAAGVKLGRIIEISENTGRPEPMPMARAMSKDLASAAAPIANGENDYSVTVNLTFAIEP